MEKIGMKKQILNAARKVAEETAANLRATMEEAQHAANEYGPPKDRYDSFRTQLLRKRDMYAQQLANVTEQIGILERINPESQSTVVEFGSVVITDFQNLFVSAGLGKVEMGDLSFFAISPAVPIYKVMEGKKAGESFIFNNKNIQIRDVL